jgi:hypothetical protein
MGAAKSVRCGRDARAHGLRTSNSSAASSGNQSFKLVQLGRVFTP